MTSSEENNRSVCVLSDAPNQCGKFYLSKLHPMLSIIPETDIKLDRIKREQQAIQTRLQAVQFWLQVQWTIIKGSLTDIGPEVKATLIETEKQLLALISEIKNQVYLLLNTLGDQSSTIKIQLKTKLLEVQTKLDYQSKAIQESC
ncbi:uncharacterized protein [Drosophila suzukii]|uniref:Uncharacterized protein n=1 Tax=Drosophila suzukii TaxID=28584 RepID=A0ABM4TTS7_DROSZ